MILNKDQLNISLDKPPPFLHISRAYTPFRSRPFTQQPPPEQKQSSEKLKALVAKTQKTLFSATSMLLFDLFPDKLTIDENKVNFIYNDIFGTKYIHSVLIENIVYVEVQLSLLTGTLIVMDSSNFRAPSALIIKNLKKTDALKARKLIQGLVHAKIVGVDFDEFDNCDELESELEKLGKVIGED